MTDVVLDAWPLSLLCHPNRARVAMACENWVHDLLIKGRKAIIPEIACYEFKREVLLRQRTKSLQYLDHWRKILDYRPLTTPIMDHAAELWAQVRRAGKPTAGNAALDADVILAAQALSLGTSVIVATSNPIHLSRFVPAERWELIAP